MRDGADRELENALNTLRVLGEAGVPIARHQGLAFAIGYIRALLTALDEYAGKAA